MKIIEALVIEEWCAAMQAAYSFARGERLAELDDKPMKRYDGRGIHPYSQMWGTILNCEALMPELAELRDTGDVACEPYTLREAARRDAERTYIAKVMRMEVNEA